MAYTQIHAVKATLSKALKYITDTKKTNDMLFGTASETAAFDFAATLSKASSPTPNLAYHLIQSFAPGEVSKELAHQIGKELADKLLEGKYSYVLSTHIDKNHVHNHLIFCAANFVDYGKFHSCKKTNYLIRQLSDTLCKEHGLSVITPGKKHRQEYSEWQANKKSFSIRETLKNDIDICISQAANYPMFLDLMRANGYEIKGESFGDGSLKYISFKPAGYSQFFRGSDRNFGPGYTKEEIQNRILHKGKLPQKQETGYGNTGQVRHRVGDDSIRIITLEELLNKKAKTLIFSGKTTLIDTTTERMLASPALLKWAQKQNLQTASHLYANMESLTSLRAEIQDKKNLISSLSESLATMTEKLIPAAEIAHTASVYRENLRYDTAMKKSRDPDRYYREHADKIELFRSAEHILRDKYGFQVETLDFEQIATRFTMMQGKKGSLQDGIKEATTELQELELLLETLENYLYPERENSSKHPDKSDRSGERKRKPDRPI